MYFQILKRDLRRKKTMNAILLIFIMLAVTFIASSASNMTSVMQALDSYLKMAEVPDFWFSTVHNGEVERFREFAAENDYDYRCMEMLSAEPQKIKIDGKVFDYSNSCSLSTLKNSTKVFDEDKKEIKKVERGEIYVTAEIFYSTKNNIREGSKISVRFHGREREFIVKGCTKDAMFGSSMIGMTRMLISEEDFAYFAADSAPRMYCVWVYEKDNLDKFKEQFNDLMLNTTVSMDGSNTGLMYMMDMLTAAIILIVSICLILISMVMLRFTIHFTISEEFREIGVMKAIGIPNFAIRGLYIAKYFMISVVGMLFGFLASIPFGNMLLESVSRNIIIEKKGIWINVVCTLATGMIVVGFCYLCTRRMKKLSPTDAIRKGDNGERFGKKGILSLNRGRLSPVPFLAVNDILSGFRKFITMIFIFALGILIIIIPVNSINTLQSEGLVDWFNMARCDHVLAKEGVLNPSGSGRKDFEENLTEIKDTLHNEGIKADVFQEIMFRMNISCGDKNASSLAFIGVGDVRTDQYAYLEGTAPRRKEEVAVTKAVAEAVDAGIGDDVQIKNGDMVKTYTVTAVYQSMNNLGEGIRFYQTEDLDFSYVSGYFGIQIKYSDDPDEAEKERRLRFLEKQYPDYKAFTAGGYINDMMGDVAGQLEGVRQMIVFVVLAINILVTVLMIKSFITKEKAEIGMLKAIGFGNGSLVAWQTVRIGIVLVIAAVLAVLLSTPLSQLSVSGVFKMMGAYNIEFKIKPLEVYVMYPLLVLIVTSLTAMAASLQLCRISPAETSNIE